MVERVLPRVGSEFSRDEWRALKRFVPLGARFVVLGARFRASQYIGGCGRCRGRDRLHIHTDNVVEELVKLRTQTILDALPSALG
jgi:hypothetical protein